MCGIAGFILGPQSDLDSAEVLRRMTDALTHRGPDGSGTHLDRRGSVGLGHRRLAIVDLSEAGSQPMVSHSGRYVITYNGEVYNFARLRSELEGEAGAFRGHSDTEVMLAAIEAWGVEEAVRRFEGMFAFALWDRREEELWLARDRLGKKPLYVGRAAGSLIFASELKSLRFFPRFDARLDRDAITLLLRHDYIGAPWSVYASVRKVPPATLQRYRLQSSGPELIVEREYWSARAAFIHGQSTRFQADAGEAVATLDGLLRHAVSDRMVADVPLGAFLSGGIDSSTVVALMQAQSSRRVRTFSIGFHEAGYDEAPHAASIARQLGTDHTEVYVSSDDALAVVPSLPSMFDEPFSDSSQIPTYLVSKIARQAVTVVLSGDGGDELFCGYPRYHKWRKVWSAIGMLPAPLRRTVSGLLRSVDVRTWDRIFALALRLRGAGRRPVSPGDRLHKLGEVLGARRPDEVYKRIVSHWTRPEEVVIGATEPMTALSAPEAPTDLDGFTEQMMLIDILTYLPGDILAKVDRASMAVSLEARCPLLDHRVVEWSMALPLGLKLRERTDKWVLRQVLGRYVPLRMFERPKMGFGVPIGSWLHGPLREWAEDLLTESSLNSDGVFNASPVRRMWAEFKDEGLPWQYLLWDVLMFQAWLHETKRGLH